MHVKINFLEKYKVEVYNIGKDLLVRASYGFIVEENPSGK